LGVGCWGIGTLHTQLSTFNAQHSTILFAIAIPSRRTAGRPRSRSRDPTGRARDGVKRVASLERLSPRFGGGCCGQGNRGRPDTRGALTIVRSILAAPSGSTAVIVSPSGSLIRGGVSARRSRLLKCLRDFRLRIADCIFHIAYWFVAVFSPGEFGIRNVQYAIAFQNPQLPPSNS